MGYVYLSLAIIAEVIGIILIIAGVAIINLFSRAAVH